MRRRDAGLDAPRRRRLAAVRLLDARHGSDRLALGVGQLHGQLPRPRRRRSGHRLLGLGRAHPRAARADRREPAGADVHGLPGAVDLRRRRTVLGTYRRRGVPCPPRLRHHALAALPDSNRADDGGRTTYHNEPLEEQRDHGGEGALRLRPHAHRSLHREHAAAVRGIPAPNGISSGPRSVTVCRSSSPGPGPRSTGSRPSRWSSPRRSTPTG